MPLNNIVSTAPQVSVIPQATSQPTNDQSLDAYSEMASRIVRAQEKIIGVLAIEQASMIPGLNVIPSSHQVIVVGDGSQVVNQLITQYRNFFGAAAVEVCRDAVAPLISKVSQLPESLK